MQQSAVLTDSVEHILDHEVSRHTRWAPICGTDYLATGQPEQSLLLLFEELPSHARTRPRPCAHRSPGVRRSRQLPLLAFLLKPLRARPASVVQEGRQRQARVWLRAADRRAERVARQGALLGW